MLRILHVHSGNLFGGVERVLLTLVSVSPEVSGLQHEFALCFSGGLSERLGQAASPVHWLGEVQIRKPWTVLRARRRLRRLLSERQFDVVFIHSSWAQALFGRVANEFSAASAFWLHDVIDGKHWLQKWAARHRPDATVANSHYTASGLHLLFSDVPAEVVYCPVNERQAPAAGVREELRRSFGVGENEVVILQVGRVEPFKGQRVLIEALGELKDLPGWTCWQVGSAQRPVETRYLRELEELARAVGISDRVRFIHKVADIAAVYEAADIYCQPNTGPEGLGLTLAEALEAGLPVVTSNIGGGVEVVDGCGWLITPGDRRGLQVVLRDLVKSPELRAKYVEAGEKRAHDMTDPAKQSIKLRNVLSAAVDRKRQRSAEH